jgi:glycosyltransferase involved in cell wall biosynthesis
MKVLFLAPQPFFTERGTPIAIRYLIESFSKRGWHVDLLTFHEGVDVRYPNLTITRIPRLSCISNIPPGLSLKKLICDVFFLFKAMAMIRRGRYDYIHASEESVFVAMFLKKITGIPFVYDMDSSMPEQVADSHRSLRFLLPLMRKFEAMAVRGATVVVAVCDALKDIAIRAGAKRVFMLLDPPAFSVRDQANYAKRRTALGVTGTCFMYVGNFEKYQGIDLLINGFAQALRKGVMALLFLVGGAQVDIDDYEVLCRRLKISDKVRFVGPKSVASVGELVVAADVLVAPRTKGVNTPMKIYSYLNSGKPILATDIKSHTQVLSPETALLEPPDAEALADGMVRLSADPELRKRLADNAAHVAAEKYSQAAFDRTVSEFCSLMESLIRV